MISDQSWLDYRTSFLANWRGLSVSIISNRNYSPHIPTQIISIYFVKELEDHSSPLSRCILQHLNPLSSLFFRFSKPRKPNHKTNRFQLHFGAKLSFQTTPKSRPFYIIFSFCQKLFPESRRANLHQRETKKIQAKITCKTNLAPRHHSFKSSQRWRAAHFTA